MRNNYNERSWAIDVITEINLIVTQRQRTIRRAGGERTLRASTQANSLFPDVLLFQDDHSLRILQGWELKMPDTPITDAELIGNATAKANLLGLNSFLVWNVTQADLYVKQPGGNFTSIYQWTGLIDITRRTEVEANRVRWVAELATILDDLERFFAEGQITGQNIIESFSENKIIDIITGNIGLVKQRIQAATQQDAMLSAAINEWWENIKVEYSTEPDAQTAISKLVLIAWVNRFLFTHYLKQFTNKALEVDDFDHTYTVEQAKAYFADLTAESDFLNVYAPVIAEDYIDPTSWLQILQLNSFLSELRLQDIDQRLLQQFFEQLLLVSKRKAAGQYATPYPIADYLARIVMLDRTLPTMDAFCGTGTILRAVYDLKTEVGIQSGVAIGAVWGSDKYSFPLQMSTLSLAKPEVMGQVLNIFKSDVRDLASGTTYAFVDPNTGETIDKALPEISYIISNLPFVEASKIPLANPQIFSIVDRLKVLLQDPDFAISSKSDLIAYLPFYLWSLLAPGGRLGLIVSNSWLGTEWGEEFRTILNRFFIIDKVVTSGNGKWFQNAAVVTNLLVLTKRDALVAAPGDTEQTDFVTMKRSVSELADKAIVEQAASQTLLRRSGQVDVRSWTQLQMNALAGYGLGWSAYFANLTWFNTLSPHLIAAQTLFDINRGERRGWDPLFFPAPGHGIEPQYIRPVLINFRDVTHLVANADGIAFCCGSTAAQLTAEGSTGALAWIRRFETARNGTGKLLPTVLTRANHQWYEMKDNTVADLVGTINYGETLFIAKMQERAFVNQRLIRFTVKADSTDIDLCHALLNSYIGIFYIEALGFGRGQGALDLNSTKVRDNLFMLNPASLTDPQKAAIKAAFATLQGREILKVPEELEQADRIDFERVVAQSYGIPEAIWSQVKQSLIDLFNIRTTVHIDR